MRVQTIRISKVYKRTEMLKVRFLAQAPVVQRADNSIHRINNYPADNELCFVNTYLLDSDLSGGKN